MPDPGVGQLRGDRGCLYRIAGPGRGPGPEYRDDALAVAAKAAAEMTNVRTATSVTRVAPLTPAKSRTQQEVSQGR